MGSQGPGRKRTPNKNGLTAEEDALNLIAREAESRLAAKRAARAEAREIRMRELERQQKEIYQVQKKYYGLDNLDNKWGDIEQWMENSERYTQPSQRHGLMSDDEERTSVGSRNSLQLNLESVGAHEGLSQVSSLYSYKNLKKKNRKKKKHSSQTSNGYDDDYNTKSSRGSLEESLCSSSWRSSSRAPSEYSELLGSSYRMSSRVSSRCSSPADTAVGSCLPKDLDHVTIPDLPNISRRLLEGSSRGSTLSTATLTSLGGTSCRGSGDSSVITDAETSIQEMKDSLAEMEEKYRKAMVSNAQLDNEKSNLMYQVDTLKDSLMELEELLAETRREFEEKSKDLEREKHAHSILQFKFSELEETLKQSEELLTEIRQLRLRQDDFVREVSDLQETIEWKDKKIGALERQKEYSDAIRNERDELRDEVVQLRDILKKHGIVLGPDLSTIREVGDDVTDGSTCTEVKEGSSVLGTQEMQLVRGENVGGCRGGKDQHPKDLDHGMQGNHLPPHAYGSSSEAPLATQNYNEHLWKYLNNDLKQIQNNVEKSQNVVFDPEDLMSTSRFKDEVKKEKEVVGDNSHKSGKFGELEPDPLTEGPEIADQNKSLISVKITEVIKEGNPGFANYACEVPLVSPEHGYKPAETVVGDAQDKKTEEQSRRTDEKVQQSKSASIPSKKKKKKKKNKQKQKQCCDEKEGNTESQEKNENQLKTASPVQIRETNPECNSQFVEPSEDMVVNEHITTNLDDEGMIQPLNKGVDCVKLQSPESRTDVASSCGVFLESSDKTENSLQVKNEKEETQEANVSAELKTDDQIARLNEMKHESVKAVKDEKATQGDVQHGCYITADDEYLKPCFEDLSGNTLEMNYSSAEMSTDSSSINKQYQVMTAIKLPGEDKEYQEPTDPAPESKVEENVVECRESFERHGTVLEESSVMPNCFSVKTNEEVIGSKEKLQEKNKAWQEQESDPCATGQEQTGKNSEPQEITDAQDADTDAAQELQIYEQANERSEGEQQTSIKREGCLTQDQLVKTEEKYHVHQQQDIPENEEEHLEIKDTEHSADTVLEESLSVMPNCFSVKTKEEVIGSKEKLQEKNKAWQEQESDPCTTGQEQMGKNSEPQEITDAQDADTDAAQELQIYEQASERSEGEQQTSIKREGCLTQDQLVITEEKCHVHQQQDIPENEEEHLEMKDTEHNADTVLEESLSVMPNCFSVKTKEEVIGSKEKLQEKNKAWQEQESDPCTTGQEQTGKNSEPQEITDAQDADTDAPQELQIYEQASERSEGEQQTSIKREGCLTQDQLVITEEKCHVHQQQDIPENEEEHLEIKDTEHSADTVLEESLSVMPNCFSVKTKEEVIGSKEKLQEKNKAWQEQESDPFTTGQEQTGKNNEPQEITDAQDADTDAAQELQICEQANERSEGEQQTSIKREGCLTQDQLVKTEEKYHAHQQQDIPENEEEHLEMKDTEHSVGRESDTGNNFQNLDKPHSEVVELGLKAIDSIIQGGGQNLGEHAVLTGINKEDSKKGSETENKKGKGKSREDCKMS
ncbi:midasin isoform X5 [Colossoma macropomum]|uniref:midasin isoform X5 n=1 Tax=Colossoma macropomum TaxID=42526 RepID=UPI0018646F12|nr:midasin isoform X5 [Colossoma macropomum]